MCSFVIAIAKSDHDQEGQTPISQIPFSKKASIDCHTLDFDIFHGFVKKNVK